MAFNSWVDFIDKVPIDLSKIHDYVKNFKCNVSINITINNINNSKLSLIEARGDIEVISSLLVQLFKDSSIITDKTEEGIIKQLCDDFARVIKNLRDIESTLMIKFDEPNQGEWGSRVGISRLGAYARYLKNIFKLAIEEPLFQELKKWDGLDKSKKNQKIFIFLFFERLQMTMSVFGSEVMEKGQKRIKSISPQDLKQLIDGKRTDTKKEKKGKMDKEEEQEDEEIDEEEIDEEEIDEEEEDGMD